MNKLRKLCVFPLESHKSFNLESYECTINGVFFSSYVNLYLFLSKSYNPPPNLEGENGKWLENL